ncbi:MAG: peptidase M23 [Parcubacteria group bacterium GW2011_GWD2_42_14]|nr:MAG: peptidase M23 [Parcubacteria group bacterium GW2011_GWD2_42_14]
MHNFMRRTVFVYLLCFSVLSLGAGYFAFETTLAASIDEATIAKRRAQLESELAHLETLIKQQQEILQSKQGERVSLERDLEIIDAEISKSRLAIDAQRVAIADLTEDIFLKEATVLELQEKINREKESLAGLVRRTAELDDQSLVEVVFSGKSFSEFFEEVDDFHEVKLALEKSFRELEGLRDKNLDAAQILSNRKAEEEELHELQKLQRDRLQNQESEKAKVLRATKGEESKYQEYINTNQKTAAQIRTELFELRGTSAINLVDAIEFATFAGNKTGVRPAFILGVLKQETRLGEFLGNGTWSVDMHPTRDRPVFQVIVSTLGLDPNSMPVSAKPGYGWGGAMGPAQFIPSTWACYGGYINLKTGGCGYSSSVADFYAGPWKYDANADRLRVVRGKQSPSNPWDNQDAFLATALYMKDLGADAGTLAAERMAALKYFAGGNATNPAYAFYGDGVMGHAADFQSDIDILKSL